VDVTPHRLYHNRTTEGVPAMTDSEFNIPQEIWKPIPDYPGYEVSDHGRVRSFWRSAGKGKGAIITNSVQKIRKPRADKEGYFIVRLCKNGRGWNMRVHRLVLFTFVGSCPFGMQACHNDGKPANNYLINLRWDTPLGNGKDTRKHGTAKGPKNGRTKLIQIQIVQIRKLVFQGYTQRKVAKMFNVCFQTINDIVHRQTWAHID